MPAFVPFTNSISMPPLLVVRDLTAQLEQQNIRYCHWKSNEHVDAAVEGKTDLDVLVDKSQKANLEEVLSEVGFKYFEAISCRRYVGIEDYLAIDPETGILVHLHLHYTLEMGEKNLKGYDLPWDELVLSSRIYDSEHHIYISEPNIEIIILIVRAALKVRTRDRLQRWLKHDYFKGDFIREFRWLKDRIDLDKVRHLSEKLLGIAATNLVLEVIGSESKLKKILRLNNPIQVALQPYRRYHPLVATGLRWQRESENLFYQILRKYFQVPVPARRTPVGGGVMIAVLGADGSGKSTITAAIVKGLSKKLDVMPVYLGSGDGTASWFRMPLVWATRSTKLRSKRSANLATLKANPSPGKASSKSKLAHLVKLLWAITLVYEKENKLKQSRQASDRGMIIISDRYPQSQVLGFNDGPLLSNGSNHSPTFPRSLRQWEFDHYQHMAEKMPPDLVIKLNVTPEVALARKPESPAEVVRQKVDAIRALEFPAQTIVVNIDATQPLDEVLLKAKQAVWETL
ncbi:hypothetical protein [Phormidesmis priestleyi]|nr:hypothetical protein [Phormidesmis priestleyi]